MTALLPRLIALASRLKRQGRPRVEVIINCTSPDGRPGLELIL